MDLSARLGLTFGLIGVVSFVVGLCTAITLEDHWLPKALAHVSVFGCGFAGTVGLCYVLAAIWSG